MFSYFGKSEIEFSKRNAVLGENGFGKTSFLNSLKFAFGRDFENYQNRNATSRASVKVVTEDFTIFRDIELQIDFGDEVLKDDEAKEFLNSNFPDEILDFLFFDGEIENIAISNSKALKKIISIVFDFDILQNLENDLKRVRNRLLKKTESKELDRFKSLNQEKVDFCLEIHKLEESRENLQKEISQISKEIQKIDSKIVKESEEVGKFETQIGIEEANLKEKTELFKKINLFQFPLILNSDLSSSVSKDENFLTIKSEDELKKRLEEFYSATQSGVGKSDFIELFYSIFKSSFLNLKTEISKEELFQLFTEISEISSEIEKLKSEQREVTKNNSKTLELQKSRNALSEKLKNLELQKSESDSKIGVLKEKLKKVESNLRIEFLNQKEKVSALRSIEEIDKQVELTKELLESEIEKSVQKFNFEFQKNLEPFYKKYPLEEKLFLKDFSLEVSQLSAGQKQIVNFILIQTLLEISNLTETIFVDTPFGRLSNENRKLILEIYKTFPSLTLLLTSSEEVAISKEEFSVFQISQNSKGSEIG
jgi:DNA sulfur modification protein DndD